MYLIYGNTTLLLADSSFWLRPRRKVDLGVALGNTVSCVLAVTCLNSSILVSSHSELIEYTSSYEYH